MYDADMAELIYSDRGVESYGATLALQQRLVARMLDSPAQAYLLTVEHPPVITLGRAANRLNVLAGEAALAKKGIELHATTRGGDVTYHGPGQLVAYPILRIDRSGLGVKEYLRRLEEVIIRVLSEFGITGGRIAGLTGVWVDQRKVAAMGVAVRRWVAWHGTALNVCPDMSHFDLIVPCGISDKKVVSMCDLLHRGVTVAEVKPILVKWMAQLLEFDSVRQVDDERL